MRGRPHQEIRPSQWITTFGPGSIVETRSGPVVLASIDDLFRRLGNEPQDFEIPEERLSRVELDGGRIVHIPTNAELNLPADDWVYPTFKFPYWSLCTQHRPIQILYRSGEGCPQCSPVRPGERFAKAGREAIRFVRACGAGHLDDVDWQLVVHGGMNCSPNYYVWQGGGRALRNVTITCPQCRTSVNFGQAYGRTWPCSCRTPEHGPRPEQSTCSRGARIIQRGAANLRLAELVTALTITDIPERLHRILSDREMLAVARTLESIKQLSQVTFLQAVENLSIPESSKHLLQTTPWERISEALDHLQGRDQGASDTLRDPEFRKLVSAAESGAPPVRAAQPGGPPVFEVRVAEVRRFQVPESALELRVTPVHRLRVVMVQRGYTRQVDRNPPEVMPTSIDRVGQRWFPGIELYGEGIFIDLPGRGLPLSGDRVRSWETRAHESGESIHQPQHVWWHSLAHRLIRSLSVDSGYSSASIRERIYLSGGQHDQRGGVLLYTAQPGGDGTLGGLIALAAQFDSILSSALGDVDSCSNDPLCAEAPSVGADGAACYSCLYASETSCDHRNLGLDRLLLAQNL